MSTHSHYRSEHCLVKPRREGVEAVDQIRLLRELRDLAQGYYFSRPLPADDLLPLLQATAPYASAVVTAATRFRTGRAGLADC